MEDFRRLTRQKADHANGQITKNGSKWRGRGQHEEATPLFGEKLLIMHTSKKRKEKKRKKGRCNYANWLASPMVSFWKSVILLNHNGGRVGEQSVPFEDRDSKVEDSLPKGFFFLPS